MGRFGAWTLTWPASGSPWLGGQREGYLEDKERGLVSNPLGQSAKPLPALPASGHTAVDGCLTARPLASKRGREEADTRLGHDHCLQMTCDLADTHAAWGLRGTRLASDGRGQKAYYVPGVVWSEPRAPTPP